MYRKQEINLSTPFLITHPSVLSSRFDRGQILSFREETGVFSAIADRQFGTGHETTRDRP